MVSSDNKSRTINGSEAKPKTNQDSNIAVTIVDDLPFAIRLPLHQATTSKWHGGQWFSRVFFSPLLQDFRNDKKKMEIKLLSLPNPVENFQSNQFIVRSLTKKKKCQAFHLLSILIKMFVVFPVMALHIEMISHYFAIYCFDLSLSIDF